MINKKNFYYISICYLTICCSLYHIIYWIFFGLDGLSFVSIEDIIMTFLNSIFFTFITPIFGLLFGIITFNDKPKQKIHKIKKLIITVELIIICLIYISIISFFPNYNFIEIILFFAAFIISEWIEIDLIFDKEFDTKINKKNYS